MAAMFGSSDMSGVGMPSQGRQTDSAINDAQVGAASISTPNGLRTIALTMRSRRARPLPAASNFTTIARVSSVMA